MEYYRLILGQGTDCARNRHVNLLLSCTYPSISTHSETFFADLQEIWPTLFFSKKAVIRKFSDDTVFGDLLSCDCSACQYQRDRQGTSSQAAIAATKSAIAESKQTHVDPVVIVALAVLVYLDKLEFFYRLTAYKIDGTVDILHVLSSPEVLKKLIDWELGRKIFRSALEDVVARFDPKIFKVEPNGFCRGQAYLDNARFPFLDIKEPIKQGSFGEVIKFQIPEEYLPPSIKKIMDGRYRTSIREPGGNLQYRFVRKVVSLREDTLNTMENMVAQLVAMLREPAATNLITLLAFYTWKNKMYFVFPCLETDLYNLLRQKQFPVTLTSQLGWTDLQLAYQIIGCGSR